MSATFHHSPATVERYVTRILGEQSCYDHSTTSKPYVIELLDRKTRVKHGYLDQYDVCADEDLAHARVFEGTDREIVQELYRARREWVYALDHVLQAVPVEYADDGRYGNGVKFVTVPDEALTD